jgi:hypothetical protein
MAGTLVANTINTDTGLFSTNNAYSGIAKAWVNCTPATGSGTIVSSFNVSSVTKNASGNYTINYSTAFANSNYAVFTQTGASGISFGGAGGPMNALTSWNTTSTQILTGYVSGGSSFTANDYSNLYVAVFSA